MVKEYTVTMEIQVPIEVTVQAIDEDNAADLAWDAINEPYALMEALDSVPRHRFYLRVSDVQGESDEI